jgi:hypothetical protein
LEKPKLNLKIFKNLARRQAVLHSARIYDSRRQPFSKVQGSRTGPYEQGANLTDSHRLQLNAVRELLNIKKNFENERKIDKSFWTQKVYQDILKTQRLTKQEKNETRANGHRKIQKATKKWDFSPV